MSGKLKLDLHLAVRDVRLLGGLDLVVDSHREGKHVNTCPCACECQAIYFNGDILRHMSVVV